MMDTFWGEPDEHQLRREREAGEAATRKQKTRDGHETFRIQAMQERPFCQNCGRHYAWCQYHDKRYCMTCAPCEVEPIQPPGYAEPIDRWTVRRKCGFCGQLFTHPSHEKHSYCGDECKAGQKAKDDKRRADRKAMMQRARAEDHRQLVDCYVKQRMTLAEVGARFGLSQYQVTKVLDDQGVARRSHMEAAKMHREKNE